MKQMITLLALVLIGQSTTAYAQSNCEQTCALNVKRNGTVFRANGAEAIWFNGDYFSWGYAGNFNRFADGIHIGGGHKPPYRGLIVDGKVGIGTSSPVYKLDVDGTLRAKKVIVESDCADFVFEDDYQLMQLDHLEEYIKSNKHLPGIPTAQTVQQDGVSIGQSQAQLLQKIEELTLYVIDINKNLNKTNREQAQRIEYLEKKLNQLKD